MNIDVDRYVHRIFVPFTVVPALLVYIAIRFSSIEFAAMESDLA